MTTLRVVLGDQLSLDVSALEGFAAGDVVLMAEVLGECTYVRHHAKKLVLVLSAMRHFADVLRQSGRKLDYVQLDDPANTHSLSGEVARAMRRHSLDKVIATEPGEWRVLQEMRGWESVEIRDDGRFLCGIRQFRRWAGTRRAQRMEFFYREMRRHYRILMDGDAPAGERWNFDQENRKRLPATVCIPKLPTCPPDVVTQEVMSLVSARFPDHFGSVEGFDMPVTTAFIWQLAGRYASWRAFDLPRGHRVDTQYRPSRSAETLPRGGGGIPVRHRAAERGGGVHSPDLGMAGIRARCLLDAHAELRHPERVTGATEVALVLLVG